jgi:uncharacterized protein
MCDDHDGEAARLARHARELSRLTRDELARRVGVPQSVISAYERCRLPTVRRLVEASGQALVVETRAIHPLDVPDTRVRQAVSRKRSAVRELAARYGATNVRLFGSVARREESDGSDIDLVADLPETTSLLELIALRRLLGELS